MVTIFGTNRGVAVASRLHIMATMIDKRLFLHRSAIALAGLLLAATGFVAPGFVGAAQAQGIERLGDFGDWSAFRFEDSGKTACYMASQPKKDEGKYQKRGDIYAIVTHRPAEKRQDEVSFVAGYRYEKDSTIEVTIGNKTFSLFTQNDGAWAPDEKTDKSMVVAMKKGNSMVVKGTSSRGTKTTDTYSLKGFSKTYKAIGKACGL